jgi:hypothetical protein
VTSTASAASLSHEEVTLAIRWSKRGVYGPWTMHEIVITCEIPLNDPNGNARDDVEIEILASKEMQRDMLTRQGSGWKHRWSRRWRSNF